MKFIINRNILENALNSVSRGLSSKTPMPVLTGIKMVVNEKELVMISSNKEISVKVTIPVDDNLNVEEIGSCVIPGKFFIDIVKRIEGNTLEFTLFDTSTIKIIADRSNFTLIALDETNFPNINFGGNSDPIVIKSKKWKQIIKQTAFAAGTSETRITLTGVCIDINGQELKAIATDSYRLARKVMEFEEEYPRTKINIPSKALDEFGKIIIDDEKDIKLYVSNNKALFKYENITFLTRLIEGSYPDTTSLFPKDNCGVVCFSKNDLIATIDRTSLFTSMDNANIVKMNFREDKTIQISSNSTEIGNAMDEIYPIKESEIGAFQIAFSAKYFLDAIKAFESSEIIIKFTGEMKPFTLEGKDEKGLIQLILPVKIFSGN